MTREEILNKIAVKEFDCLFNEIVQLTNRVLVLNMGFNELLKQINDLSLGNVTNRTLKCNRCSAIYALDAGETVGCCVAPAGHRTSLICGGELIDINT